MGGFGKVLAKADKAQRRKKAKARAQTRAFPSTEA
jgi:hypothetical protein